MESKNENAGKAAKLNEEQCLSLITEVHARPELWQKTHASYKNKHRTTDLWVEVASTLGISVDDAKNGWTRLRTCYRTIRARVRALPTGSASSGTNKPSRWFAFEAMGFVEDNDLVGETTDSLQTTVCRMEKRCRYPVMSPGSGNDAAQEQRSRIPRLSRGAARSSESPETEQPDNDIPENHPESAPTTSRRPVKRLVRPATAIDPLFTEALQRYNLLCEKITNKLDNNSGSDVFLAYLKQKMDRKKSSERDQIERQLLQVLDMFEDDTESEQSVHTEYLEEEYLDEE